MEKKKKRGGIVRNKFRICKKKYVCVYEHFNVLTTGELI